MADKICFFLS